MTPAQKADEFVARYNNTHIDEDGYYGAQCWDVAARYAREYYNCPSFPTGSGGAEGVYRLFQDPLGTYFNRIANNTADPNQVPAKGDIVVFQASFSPPYGHIGVCLGADASGVTLFEQNGNNPSGVAYIKKRGWSGVSGWLSPKAQGEIMSKVDLGIGRIITWGILGRNGIASGNALNGETDADINQNHVGFETNEKIWQLYNSGEGQDWIHNRLPKLVDGAAKTAAIGKQLSDANGVILALQTQVKKLGENPTPEQMLQLQKALKDANDKAVAAQAELEKIKGANTKADEQTTSFLRAIWRKIMGN